jgi:hypothetical protein
MTNIEQRALRVKTARAQVEHIRGDRHIQADNEVFASNGSLEKQGKLLDADETPAWKSIPSVLRAEDDDLRLRNSGRQLWADEPADEFGKAPRRLM